ncbi:MAG: FAD-binding oxidoreductase [Candidatus Hermodarchaeota archaeon]
MSEEEGKVVSDALKTKSKRKFEDVVKEFISPYHVSTNPYELESASADLTSLPSYHYKFKKNYLGSIIVRPADSRTLSLLIKKCYERKMAVTIRSAGTSCFSSSTPAKGGVIIDIRRINKVFDVDTEKMTVKVGTGISWLNLIERLTDYGLAPKCYPTSFKTSCVGGFIATPGKAGIGVLKYGEMKDSIISLLLIKPDGSNIKITRDSKGDITLDDICGTYGIYGAISEVELSVTTLKSSLEIVGYGFLSLADALDFYYKLKNNIEDKPLFLSISNREFERYSHVNYPKENWLVWAVFYDDPEKVSTSISSVREIAANSRCNEVETSYLKEKWRDISDAEVAIGRTSKNLIFQEYWIKDDRLISFFESYTDSSQKYRFPTASYAISGAKGWTRVKVFGLTDIDRPIEFFTVKAFLHDLSVKAFNAGDSVYTIGIVNTFYLLKYRREEVNKRKQLKSKLDPKDLFNSYRITKARMKFWRISLLFWMAKFIYLLFLKNLRMPKREFS